MTGGLGISFLGSGSTGNCAVVRCGRTTVLLDAGLSVRETERRLAERGASLEEVEGIFITHEHSDHVRTAETFALRFELPVFATSGTARAAGLPGPLLADVRILRAGSEVTIGELHVQAIPTPHDGVESVCYVFTDGAGRRVGVATDLGHLAPGIAEALSGCDVLGLEANHDVALLRDGPYPLYLKRRILSSVGHLSNEAAAEGLRTLVGPRTRAVAALHISRHNNTPALAGRAFGVALESLGARLPLEVASHDCPTRWLFADGEDDEGES